MSYYIECNDWIIIGINHVGIGCKLWYFELEINLFGFRIILIVFRNVKCGLRLELFNSSGNFYYEPKHI